MLAVPVAILLTACSAPRPDPSLHRFDGTYRGSATPATGNNPNCDGDTKRVHVVVSDGRAEVPSRHRHRRMDGTVDAEGQITLREYSGDRVLNGHIAGDALTGTEMEGGSPHGVTARVRAGAGSCTYWVQATRTAGSATKPSD
ncbi:hypothetical protein [Rhizosaccharibacter radicis]|uniref:Lipoprotein n=1 Tax=Rhizosaccharibacter radicis TaxID=2782605 RepID=A0ABT1VV03_9PROT|nr:hypothetical protein [Acetobacteraceae bacterium KSS12]